MGNPITWRNVTGPDPAQAAYPMAIAQQTLNGAFDQFSNIIKQREAGIANAAQLEQENLKTNFLAKLQSVRTPEELAALQASGGLDQTGMTAATRALVMGAPEARITSLRQGVTAEQAYGSGQVAVAEAPKVAAIKTLALTDPEAAQKALETAGLRDPSVLQQFINENRLRITNADNAKNDREAAIKLRDINYSTAVLNSNAAKQAADDAAEGRKLEARLATEQAAHAASQNDIGGMQGRVASTMGLPLNSRGFPDFANMTAKQIEDFDTKAKATGIPLSSVVRTGDTGRGDAFITKLRQSGEFSDRVLRANENAIRGVFNSAPATPTGNDAFNVALATAQNQVAFDRQDASNWYAPGSQDARRSYDELASKIPDIVADMPSGVWFGDNKKDIPDLQRMLGEIASTGILRKDGSRVTPSVNDVLRFVRSEDGGFRDAKRAENIKERLTDWLNSPEGIKMSEDGLKSQVFRDKQRVTQILNDARNPPKK